MSEAVPAATPAADAAPVVASPATPPAPETGAAPKEQSLAPVKTDATASADGIEIKLPEGAKIDQAQIDSFKAKAKELGLDSKTASALVEYQYKAGVTQMEALKQQIDKSRAADLEALKGDPEFGGAKFDRTVADARSALQQFGGEKVSKLFEEYGIDKHPDVAKMLARVRAAIAEDSTSARVPKVPPDAPPQQPLTQLQRIAQRYDKKQQQQQR